jgi:hypothetical protein
MDVGSVFLILIVIVLVVVGGGGYLILSRKLAREREERGDDREIGAPPGRGRGRLRPRHKRVETEQNVRFGR